MFAATKTILIEWLSKQTKATRCVTDTVSNPVLNFQAIQITKSGTNNTVHFARIRLFTHKPTWGGG